MATPDIPLDQLLIANCQNKQDFIACFMEFARAERCLTLLAWHNTYQLSYTELRKLQLACNEGSTLYVLFRPQSIKHQSSPAPLRVTLTPNKTMLQLNIFKQRGMLNTREVSLDLPKLWCYDHGEPRIPKQTSKIHNISSKERS